MGAYSSELRIFRVLMYQKDTLFHVLLVTIHSYSLSKVLVFVDQ